MAYSQIVKVGDGVTTQFTVNFDLGYISQSDVTCRVGSEVDGLGAPAYRALTWIDESLVQVGGTPAGVGVNLVFTRTVSKSQLIHTYANGAAIIEENLDESFRQAIMAAQEVADGRFATMTQDIDMGNFRIHNLGPSSAPTDAVNRSELDVVVTSSGNVPAPGGGNIGKFLKATGAATWSWVSIVLADLGITLPWNIASGGTGSTTAAGALTALGAVAKAGDKMSGKLEQKQGANLASAGTVDLGAATGNAVIITSNTTITNFGTTAQDGTEFTVLFSGTPTITNGAGGAGQIFLGGGTDFIPAAANFIKTFVKIGGAWYETGSGTYQLGPAERLFLWSVAI